MKELKFRDMKKRKNFMSSKYKFTSKNNPRTKRKTYMVFTTAPSGVQSYRIVSEDFYLKNKK